MDKKIKLELEGASIVKPLDLIAADIKRIEELRPASISASLTTINSIKHDNEFVMEQVKSRITIMNIKPNLKLEKE